jgi:hypothetical protein
MRGGRAAWHQPRISLRLAARPRQNQSGSFSFRPIDELLKIRGVREFVRLDLDDRRPEIVSHETLDLFDRAE